MSNKHREHHMLNIYKAVHSYCREGEIFIVVDGDDVLVGKYVFKLINAVYFRMRGMVIYTNHIESKREVQLDIGISRSYTDEVKDKNSYRLDSHLFSHLRTTWVDLFFLIKEEDFKDKKGQWFDNAVDNAIFYPIFEMSCI